MGSVVSDDACAHLTLELARSLFPTAERVDVGDASEIQPVCNYADANVRYSVVQLLMQDPIALGEGTDASREYAKTRDAASNAKAEGVEFSVVSGLGDEAHAVHYPSPSGDLLSTLVVWRRGDTVVQLTVGAEAGADPGPAAAVEVAQAAAASM